MKIIIVKYHITTLLFILVILNLKRAETGRTQIGNNTENGRILHAYIDNNGITFISLFVGVHGIKHRINTQQKIETKIDREKRRKEKGEKNRLSTKEDKSVPVFILLPPTTNLLRFSTKIMSRRPEKHPRANIEPKFANNFNCYCLTTTVRFCTN